MSVKQNHKFFPSEEQRTPPSAGGRSRGGLYRTMSEGSRSTSCKEPTIQILLIGKTGNGKSSVGNGILGGSYFKVATGILSATTRTQLAQRTVKHKGEDLTVQVLDFPDVTDWEFQEEEDKARQTELCKDLTFPFPHAVCLVVRADIRFTPEEYVTYLETRKLLGDRLAHSLMVVVFTMVDRLSDNMRANFDLELQRSNQQLKQVISDARSRYILFDHSAPINGRSKLLDIILSRRRTRSIDCQPVCAVLLGAAGSGKSDTGKCLALDRTQSSTKNRISIHLQGFQLEIYDEAEAPSEGPQSDNGKLEAYARDCVAFECPHVIIYVIKACDIFKIQALAVLHAVLRVSEDPEEAWKRLLLVFTGDGTLPALDKMLEAAPESLRELLLRHKMRYILFNNTADDIQEMVLQRNRLLATIDDITRTCGTSPLKVQRTKRPSERRQRGEREAVSRQREAERPIEEVQARASSAFRGASDNTRNSGANQHWKIPTGEPHHVHHAGVEGEERRKKPVYKNSSSFTTTGYKCTLL